MGGDSLWIIGSTSVRRRQWVTWREVSFVLFCFALHCIALPYIRASRRILFEKCLRIPPFRLIWVPRVVLCLSLSLTVCACVCVVGYECRRRRRRRRRARRHYLFNGMQSAAAFIYLLDWIQGLGVGVSSLCTALCTQTDGRMDGWTNGWTLRLCCCCATVYAYV